MVGGIIHAYSCFKLRVPGQHGEHGQSARQHVVVALKHGREVTQVQGHVLTATRRHKAVQVGSVAPGKTWTAAPTLQEDAATCRGTVTMTASARAALCAAPTTAAGSVIH